MRAKFQPDDSIPIKNTWSRTAKNTCINPQHMDLCLSIRYRILTRNIGNEYRDLLLTIETCTVKKTDDSEC